MKNRVFAALILCMVLFIACLTAASAEEITVPELTIAQREIPDNEAMAFLKEMGVGWNLGNTFDAIDCSWLRNELDYESGWCGVKTNTAMFDALKEAGFSTVRIPVSWHNHVDGDYQISQPWLDRVQEVVDWALERDLHVILNIHHDEPQFLPAKAHAEESAKYVAAIWRQLAERFRDYDHRLIFESLNEPRLLNSPYEWTFNPVMPECQEAAEVLNGLNQLFVDTVRSSGGQNADRYLMVPAYDAAPGNAVRDSFVMPSDTADNRIIISVHAYTPYDFALNIQGGASFGAQSQKQEIISFMNSLYGRYTVRGIPVVIGEYGALTKKDNLQDRVDWTAFYVAAASARNFPCMWWDNGAFAGNGELFGLLDRKTAVFAFPQIVEAIMTYGGYDKLPAPAAQ